VRENAALLLAAIIYLVCFAYAGKASVECSGHYQPGCNTANQDDVASGAVADGLTTQEDCHVPLHHMLYQLFYGLWSMIELMHRLVDMLGISHLRVELLVLAIQHIVLLLPLLHLASII
jgi:hypothetical protein